MNGVVCRLDADTRAERIADEAEDVRRTAANLVSVGDSLKRYRAQAEDEIVRTRGDLLGNSVGRADVRLGVETPQLNAAAVGVTAFRKRLEQTAPALLEHGHPRVLIQRHTKGF